MKASLLQTKLYIPPTSPELVSRPRLFERLNEGLTRRLTLIAAPAGFGKTTLVSDWLQRVDLPAAWLSLDEDDNDPSRFLTYLAAALQQIDAQMGQSVQGMLASSPPPPLESVMPAIINEIADAPPFVLALDDYDVIEAPPIHDALTFLLDHLPPQVHVIITSRADPPLPLARLRAHAQLTEVRVIDLRSLHQRASEWYENSDLKYEAIHHALKGGDFERAARLTEQSMETAIYQQGRVPPPPSPAPPLLDPLTEREGQILRLLAAGLSTPEIAEELIVAVGTVRSHVKRLYCDRTYPGRLSHRHALLALDLLR